MRSLVIILLFQLCYFVSQNPISAQFSSYNFENNLLDQVGDNDLTLLELEEPTTNPAEYGPTSTGTQILLDTTAGLGFPLDFTTAIDTTASLEIQLRFSIPDLGSGRGARSILGCQAQINEPGFSIFSSTDLFSGQDDYSVYFAYSDGGFNQGVPNHPGHESTALGTFLAGDEVDIQLVIDFADKSWYAVVNGVYVSSAIDDYYDWPAILEHSMTARWFVGWHEGQEFDMNFDPDIYTATLGVDELAMYSPVQPGDIGELITAIETMTAHANGSTPLDMATRNNLLGQIYTNFLGSYEQVADEVTAYIATYEANYEPVYASRNVVPLTNLLPESQLLIFFQQFLFDQRYAPQFLDEMAGVVFEFSELFPGSVDPTAQRGTNATLEVNGTYSHLPYARVVADLSPAKRPTGYYVPPGEIVTITIPADLVDAGLVAQIGAHDSDHSSLNATNRFVRMSKDYNLDQEVTRVLSPFGGGLYIKVPEGSDLGWFEISIDGAVASPYFSFRTGRETSPEDWAAALAEQDVEWVDLESDKYMMTLPLGHLAELTDPTSLMQQWDAIMEGFRYVGGRPVPRPRTEYFLIDSRLPGDVFGTGYPQVIGDNAAPFGPYSVSELYPTQVLNPQFWDSGIDITFHEMGHAVLHPTLITEVETIVHLNAVYIYQQLYGLSIDDAFIFSSGERHNLAEAAIDWMIADNFRNNRPMDCDPTMEDFVCDELRYQHRGHAKYIQMADIFGWASVYEMNKAFYDNWQANPPEDWMIVNADNVIRAASQGMGVNMCPLMHFWGLIPSPELIEEMAELPESQDLYQMLREYRAFAPRTAADFQPWYDRNFPKKDPVHHDRYNAALANYDSENYGQAMVDQIDYLIDLYFPNLSSNDENEIAEAIVKLYPNPSGGRVHFQSLATPVRSCKVKVYDLSGRLILAQERTNGLIEYIDIKQKGSYLIQFTLNEVNSVFKVVVE